MNTALSLSIEQQHEILMSACRLKAEYDALCAQLEPFIATGETIACPLGKLQKVRGSESITPNTEGKKQIDALKQALLAEGLAKVEATKPHLRMTLAKPE